MNKKDVANMNKLNTAVKVITVLLAIIANVIAVFGTIQNNQLAARQERFELEQQEKAAIPILRIVRYDEKQPTLEIFPDDRELSYVETENGIIPEGYFSIRNFSFENMTDNIAYINHIEYGGVAYELVSLQLTAQQGEIISFSPDNIFIGSGYEKTLTIVVRTIYNKYYSYECTLYSTDMTDGIYCYSVESIGFPREYNIDNDIYKQMEIHIRDISIYPGGITF